MNPCLCGKVDNCKSEIKRIYGDSAGDMTPSYAPISFSREATPGVSGNGWRHRAYLNPPPGDTFSTPVPDIESIPVDSSKESYNLCQKGNCCGGGCQKSPSTEGLTFTPPTAGYSVTNHFEVERKLKAEASARKAYVPSPSVQYHAPTFSGDSMEKLLAIQRQQLQRLSTGISDLEGITRRSGAVV